MNTSDLTLASSAQQALAQGHLGLAFALAAAGGFLTALSPCVYPLIPITLSVFGARDASSRTQSFLLALTYTLGMVLLYAVLGTAFASAGKVFGTLLANKWVVLGFAAFCVAMAASMLGLFELQLPSALQSRLATIGGRGYRGALAMGLVSGLIAAPCTGPVLSVLLTFIASSHNTGLGFTLMIGFGLGLGLPFLVLATFSQSLRRLPKSGAWMDVVKALLGTLMIALALYYAQLAAPQIARAPMGLGWALVALGLIALVLARRARKLAAVVLGLGVFWAVLSTPPRAEARAELHWMPSESEGLAKAHAERKPLMIDFYATWCEACKELDAKVYSQAEVQRELGRFVTVKIDGTDESDEIAALYKKYGVKGLPTVVFIGGDGQPLETPRVTGFVPAESFRALLAGVH